MLETVNIVAMCIGVATVWTGVIYNLRIHRSNQRMVEHIDRFMEVVYQARDHLVENCDLATAGNAGEKEVAH